jgi:uncharacterized membrane protein YhaH (DUF805 family)
MLIAVNLQLVVVHNVSTAGRSIYYIMSAFLATMVIAIPPAVQGIWGWDTLTHACYITPVEIRQRLVWDLVAFHFWAIATVLVAFVSVTLVLRRLIDLRRRSQVANVALSSNTSHGQKLKFTRVVWRIVLYPLTLSKSIHLRALTFF